MKNRPVKSEGVEPKDVETSEEVGAQPAEASWFLFDENEDEVSGFADRIRMKLLGDDELELE